MSSETGSNPEDSFQDDLKSIEDKLKSLYSEMEDLSSTASESGKSCKIPSGREVRRVLRHHKSDNPEDLVVTVNTAVSLAGQLNSVGK